MNWLTNDIATAAFGEVQIESLGEDIKVIDVRDLVDKSGNDLELITEKIDDSINNLQSGHPHKHRIGAVGVLGRIAAAVKHDQTPHEGEIVADREPLFQLLHPTFL